MAAAAITCNTLNPSFNWASRARASTSAAAGLQLPAGHSTGPAKNTARLAITPTTAAVIAVSGAPRRRSSRLASTRGAPARMNPNDGTKVNHTVTRVAARAAGQLPAVPSRPVFQPPMKPTKATTMIRGPGVVSPSARPSTIWPAVSQPKLSTAPWAT